MVWWCKDFILLLIAIDNFKKFRDARLFVIPNLKKVTGLQTWFLCMYGPPEVFSSGMLYPAGLTTGG